MSLKKILFNIKFTFPYKTLSAFIYMYMTVYKSVCTNQ